MASPRSVRFDEDVLDRLGRYVRSHPGSSTSSVTNLFVDEALRAYEHPGIGFRDGPTGRRAVLTGGPDVWEVIGAFKAIQEEAPPMTEIRLREALMEVTGLSADQVNTALRYYVAYPDEVDERIAANEAEAAREHALWESQRSLFRHRSE